MANDMEEEAERAYMLAEERFVAGDLAGALRSARNANRLFSSLPALQNAAAAYEVHAAAARRGRTNWYAVLGLRQEETAVTTHEDVKRQYRRLCLVLHPDKNPSAAADGAFKLLQQAWEALSARHPPGRPTPSVSASKPSKKAPPPPPPPRPRASPCRERRKTGGSQRRPPSPEWSSFGFTAPPEPDGSTAWREAYARANGAIYCGHCDTESAAAEGGAGHGKSGSGGRCH
nr:unnamed protein product [Digitaria exilis]